MIIVRSLFKKKDLNECLQHNCDKTLKRSLGSKELVIMGIGAIVGAGIFIVTGVASATSGPALVLSFIIAGIACGFTALCYAEMASLISVTGGVYTYVHVTMGEFWAWMIGWALIFEYLLSASAIAISWSSYTTGFLSSMGLALPEIITSSPLTGSGLINLPALLIIATLTGVLILGAKESIRINTAIVFIKLAVILLFIIVGAQFINPANYNPFAPNGFSGIFQGAALVFFAYIGFDAVASATEETKNPQKALPIGIIGSLIFCSILYIVVTIVLNGMAPFSLFGGSSAPIQLALEYVGVNWAMAIITVGAIAGLTTVLLTMLFGQTRIFYSMSRDGLLPGIFSKVHTNFHSPVMSIVIVGAIGSIIASFFPFNAIVELVNIGTLIGFIFLAVSLILLRRQHPDIPRKFKCPLVPVVPILSIIFCVFLIFQLSHTTLERFAISLVVGATFYFVYRRYKRRSTPQDEDDVIEQTQVIEISAK